jgi:beta-glucanase (GH16 family)
VKWSRRFVAPLAVLGVIATAGAAASASVHKVAHAAKAGASIRAATGRLMPLGAAGTWHLVLNSTFNGSTLPHLWSTGWFGSGITAPVQSEELECYSPSQVTFSGGSLDLSLAKSTHTCGGIVRHYTSGMVTTARGFSFTYGLAEARIYLPPSGHQIADWPAFWTDGRSWPADGEMDILEGLRGAACFHFHDPSGGPGGCVRGNYSGWHTYGANWEPGSVTYYYDGHRVGRITRGVTSAPMYLILNLAVDNSYGGAKVAPARMQVKFVRVWQHGSALALVGIASPRRVSNSSLQPNPFRSRTKIATAVQTHC